MLPHVKLTEPPHLRRLCFSRLHLFRRFHSFPAISSATGDGFLPARLHLSRRVYPLESMYQIVRSLSGYMTNVKRLRTLPP
ncbi:unnamed protein product [Cuscuta campestris]|uniref:Uncharacterized protein n=1 Tax=Cuscuta campestris TaxID=132261 RepID=A0A484L574_9ASTE|nr:unnamed protein product [Cuscuta campestris]